MISRRSLLVAAPLVLYSRMGRAWFPHGASAPQTSALTINITHLITPTCWDLVSNGGKFPDQATKTAVEAVVTRTVSDLESWFTTANGQPATVNIDLSYDTNAGAVTSSFMARQHPGGYAAMLAPYLAAPTDSYKTLAYPNIPGTDPYGLGVNWWVPTGNWAVMTNGNDYGSTVPGSVAYQVTTISAESSYGQTFDYTPDGSSCASGKWGLAQALKHEFTFTLGRSSELTGLMALFSYNSSTHLLDDVLSHTRYASLDGGVTNFHNFSVDNGIAEGTSWTGVGNSALNLNATQGPWTYTPGTSGTGQGMRPKDFQWMSVMGLTLTAAGLAQAAIP